MARSTRRPTDIGLDAISVEGSLIAPEQIAAIARTERTAKTAAAYDCPPGTNLGDEIARFFRIGQAHWQAYRRIEAPNVTQVAAFARQLLTDVFGFKDLTGPVTHKDGSRRYRIALDAKAGRVPIVCAAPVTGGDGFAKALPEFGDGQEGRARRSPVVLMQDWLNASDTALWGLVFAGDRLRLMRDNASLTRAAWIEADLAAIFRDEMFADFTALWLLIHASRFGVAGTPPSLAPLEAAREAGQKQGTAARERLREGVEAALGELGQGLVTANPELRERIETGALGVDALFEELLRTVYRLIFLAVAEDRDLLHPLDTSRRARDLYAGSYGFAFWRERSARRTAYDAHHDAWEGMKVTLAALEYGEPVLGLPALGGLFAAGHTPAVRAARIPNRHFLLAIHRLGFLTVDGTRTRVNWRDMKTEELGSVYESLLEIRAALRPNGEFALDSGQKGNVRKTSGSYYTPDSLVETLLDSALAPVLDRAEANGGPESILDLRVIDPACGSGHFLLGAARRMADRVAEGRNPDAPDRQAALRDVVARCIHGVDRNPMAVELAKVALWIESVTPGQPLGFLDANIRCGDALLGVFDLAVLERGIPDEAFKPLTGDDKATATGLRKLNRAERDASLLRLAVAPDTLARRFERFHALPESSVAEVRAKARAYDEIHGDPQWWSLAKACDCYVAAFLLSKPKTTTAVDKVLVPTTRHLREFLAGRPPQGLLARAVDTAVGTARAFHWPVEFPDVMIGRDGFDVVLGNPPWEVVQLSDEEYFASRAPEIAELKGATRKKAIATLQADRPEIFLEFTRDKRALEAINEFSRVSGRFDLTARGKVNTYGLFAELFLRSLCDKGRAGLVAPLGLATNETLSAFFSYLVEHHHLVSLISMSEIKAWFLGTKDNQSFCLITLGKCQLPTFAFRIDNVADLIDGRRKFSLTSDEIKRFNPNTKTASIFRTRKDADLTSEIYVRVPVLVEDRLGNAGNVWGIEFRQGLFNMTSDSGKFRTSSQLVSAGYVQQGANWVTNTDLVPKSQGHEESFDLRTDPEDMASRYEAPHLSSVTYVPLYEGKMVHHFDHRWGFYAEDAVDDTRALPRPSHEEKRNAYFEVKPRFWVPLDAVQMALSTSGWRRDWLIGWRDITNRLRKNQLA